MGSLDFVWDPRSQDLEEVRISQRKRVGQGHKIEGVLRYWRVALGSSISKKEKAMGVGLSHRPRTSPPLPSGSSFILCRVGVGRSKKEKSSESADR